jgi:hypothetical protein
MLQNKSRAAYVAHVRQTPLIPKTILVTQVPHEPRCRILQILHVDNTGGNLSDPWVQYTWIEDGPTVGPQVNSRNRMSELRAYMENNSTDVLYHLCINVLGDFPKKNKEEV